MMVWAKVKVAAVVVVVLAGAVALPVAGQLKRAAAPATEPSASAGTSAAGLLAATGPVVAVDQDVRDLIPLVEAGEARLLGDIDLTYTMQYRNSGKITDAQTIETMEQTVTVIRQGARSYKQTNEVTITDGHGSESTVCQSYDGQFTRRWADNPEGGQNPQWIIWDGTDGDPSVPEVFLVFGMNRRLMSQILKEGVPGMPGARQHLQRLPDEEYLGQKCLRVQATIEGSLPEAVAGPMTMTWWLCPGSGYLPIRMTSIAKLKDSGEVGLAVETTDEKEVAPGLLLPRTLTATMSEPGGGTQREFIIETLSLAPGYPAEKFAVAPPPGATLVVMHGKKTLAKARMDGQWTAAAAEAMLREEIAKERAVTQPGTQAAVR